MFTGVLYTHSNIAMFTYKSLAQLHAPSVYSVQAHSVQYIIKSAVLINQLF